MGWKKTPTSASNTPAEEPQTPCNSSPDPCNPSQLREWTHTSQSHKVQPSSSGSHTPSPGAFLSQRLHAPRGPFP